MKKIKIVLIGISGFGTVHLRAIERLQEKLSLKAICETNQEACKDKILKIKENGTKCYTNYLEMLAEEKDIDFVVVSTPIHLHKDMSVNIMKSGMNVLLEKPPAVTIQDIDSIIEASAKTGKLCAVDFPHAVNLGFLELMKRISDGQLGKIKAIKGKGLWKRLDSYYERTPWAGKLVYNNHYVLDGTINNPLAHLLNNMLLLAATAEDFKIRNVKAELYHAHAIDAEDTSCVRIIGESGLELLFYATLCQTNEETPMIRVEGTKGFAEWNYDSELLIHTGAGEVRNRYGNEEYFDEICRIYDNLCDTIEGKAEKLHCSIFDTRHFVLASNGAFESSGVIHGISAEHISRHKDGDSISTDLIGIDRIIADAFNQGKLYSELNVPWAVEGKLVRMDEYREFNMFGSEFNSLKG